MTTTVTYGPHQTIFECKVKPGFPGEVCVTISEVVRPSWKFFRTKFCADTCFNIDDYDTIYEGVYHAVRLYHRKKWAESEKQEKWKEFEEKHTKKNSLLRKNHR